MSLIKERILQFIQLEGFSKSEFYRRTGITRGVLDKDSGLTEANIAKFVAAFSDVSLEWLINGYGGIRSAEKLKSQIVSESSENYGLAQNFIPMYSLNGFKAFSLGEGVIAPEDIIGKYILPELTHADCILRVQGNDMSPLFQGGDLLAVKIISKEGFIQWGRPHVLLTGSNDLIIRRLQPSSNEGDLCLSTGNAKFPDFEISIQDIDAIGLVLGAIHLQ